MSSSSSVVNNPNFRTTSTKTRIETQARARYFDATIKISEPLPLKQGLKLEDSLSTHGGLNISEPLPLKQGLKPCNRAY